MTIFDTNHDVVKGLQSINGLPFQTVIETIVVNKHGDFQTVPRTPGDGGLDGISDNNSIVYCCYGLDLKSIRDNKAQRSKVVSKFKEDINKIFEVKTVKGKFAVEENKTLAGVLGKQSKNSIKIIKLICNWFEDNTVIGTLRDHFIEAGKASKNRFIAANCSLVFIGPKEVVRDFSISSEIRLQLKNPVLAKIMTDITQNNIGTVPVPSSTSEFDSKFNAIFEKNKSKTTAVQGVKDVMFDDWKKHISFQLKLEENQPSSAKALTSIITEATKQAQKLSISGKSPTEVIDSLKDDLKSRIKSKFKDFPDEHVEKTADYVVASLVGTCPLDWR